MDLLYFKINNLLWCWSLKDEARIVREASLSMDRLPPVWKETKPPPPKPQPQPPKPAEPAKKKETVPPFDIQEIPGAMRRIYLPVSASLMERWFAGRLNYSPSAGDEEREINQDGKPYPPDMHDTTTVKLDWVLKFPRAKKSNTTT